MSRMPESLLEEHGAVWDEEAGLRSPRHFGDPAAELAAAREGTVLFERSVDDRISLHGPDAAAFLHRVCTQDVLGLEEGSGALAALTDHKARFIAWGPLWRCGAEDFLWILDPGGAEPAVAWLSKHALMDEVEIEDASSERIGCAVAGAGAGALRVELGGGDPGSAGHVLEGGFEGIEAAFLTELPLAGGCFRLEVEAEHGEALWRRLARAGARPAGFEVWEALRIEAGRPRLGLEATGATHPLETGLEAAVSLDKGCYTGQETLNRLRTYGGVRRALTRLRSEGEDPPAVGEALVGEGGEVVGTVSSAAALPGEGASVALGLVDAEAARPGASLSCGAHSLDVAGPAPA